MTTIADDIDDIETTLVDSYDRILSYVRFKIGPDHAEDVTQTAMLRAISALRRGNGATEHVTGWLWRIVQNCIHDHWRETKRRQFIALDDLAEQAAQHKTLPEQMEVLETAERIHRAIDRLPETQATVATGCLEGCDFEEIAQAMDKTVGAVKALRNRALTGLHSQLGEHYGYGTERQVHQTTQAPQIAAVLQERGPLSVNDIARVLQRRRYSVYSTMALRPEQFVVVGTSTNKQGGTQYIFGLAGVHDAQEAV